MTTPAASARPIRPTLGRIMRSTAIVMIFALSSKLISLVQTLFIARQFGVSTDYDTFVAANTVPEQIFTLIAGGALSYAFIPIFGGLLAQDRREEAWKLAANVLNSVFLLAVVASVVVFITAPWLVATLVAPGFSAANQDQTVHLMRILLISLLIFSVSGLATGILQSHQHFLLPAMAPLLFDLGLLFGVLFLAPRFGIYGLVYGSLLGAAGHLAIQIPGLIAYRMAWRPIVNWRDRDLRMVLRLMIPRAIGLGLFNLNLVAAVNFASAIEGGASAFNWGWRLMQFPETLIGTAMGIVIFPTLAALSAAGDEEGKRGAMSGALRFILFSAIPAAVLLIVVGRQALRILEGGALDEGGATLIYDVLLMFAGGVIVHSAVEVVARSFYADKDTVTPLYVAVITAPINIGLAYVLSRPGALGVPGLALANTFAVGLELVILLAILRRRWHGINERALLTTVGKTALASGALAIAALGANVVLYRLHYDGKVGQIIQVVLLSGVGLGAFVAVAVALRTEEILQLPRMMAARRARRAASAEGAAGAEA